MKTIYYRPEGDRKFFSANENEVIEHMRTKRNLSDLQVSELRSFGVTQDEKHAIKSFTTK